MHQSIDATTGKGYPLIIFGYPKIVGINLIDNLSIILGYP